PPRTPTSTMHTNLHHAHQPPPRTPTSTTRTNHVHHHAHPPPPPHHVSSRPTHLEHAHPNEDGDAPQEAEGSRSACTGSGSGQTQPVRSHDAAPQRRL